MKKKLSLTEKISLAENNAVDFMHACVTIALHDEYEVGVQRLRKVNLRRDEINEEMLEVMAQPRKSSREQAAAGQAWLVSLLPEGGGNGVPGAVGTAAAAGRGAGRRGAGDGGRCGSGAVRERRQRMSKDKGRMSRKRISKKIAGRFGGQVPEVRDIVRKNLVDPLKRRQEKIVTAKHRAGKQEGKAV